MVALGESSAERRGMEASPLPCGIALQEAPGLWLLPEPASKALAAGLTLALLAWLPALERLQSGTDAYPDQSATCVVEVATLAINWLVFRLLVRGLRVPMEIATFVGSFLVFALFSYPIWRLVFRVPPGAAS